MVTSVRAILALMMRVQNAVCIGLVLYEQPPSVLHVSRLTGKAIRPFATVLAKDEAYVALLL